MRTYTGNTKNYLDCRLGTYQNAAKNKNPNESALVRHSFENAHHFDFQIIQVVVFEMNNQKRTVLTTDETSKT